MTVSTFAKCGPYVGDGGTTNGGHQQFTIDFEFFATSEIVATTRVTATGAEATLASNAYTITGTGSSPYTGGTLTLVGSLAATSTLTISRSVPQIQDTDLVTGDTLPAETLEDRYDRLTLMVQDVQEQVNRCLQVPVTDGSTVETACKLADSKARASSYLTFDSNGLPSATGTAITGTTASSFAATLLDDANAAAALTTLGITAAAQTILDDTTVAAIRTTLGVPAGVVVLDENDMASHSDTEAPSQHSVETYVKDGTLTLTNKTLTSPAINTGTLTSPVINTGVSGTAIDTDGTLAANSDTKLASQKAVKTYVGANISVFAPTVAAQVQAGTVSCTLPNGLIFKWGSQALTSSTSYTDTTVTFAVAFPTGCYNVQVTPSDPTESSGDYGIYAHSLSATIFKIRARISARNTPVYWLAVGY